MNSTFIPETETSHAATRDHLLEAAGMVFAEVGYKAATVRQICERAGANIAAVNYHFGDKEALYKAVIGASHAAAMKQFPPDIGLRKGASAERRLEAFVRSFLLRIFSEGPCAWHGKIMTREMIEPTGALEEIVRNNIQPMSAELHSIVRELMGPKASKAEVRLYSMSIVSQVLFYHHCRPAVSVLFPDADFSMNSIDLLGKHITRFSLGAIKQFAAKKG